jgi:hypothetical protein
MDTVETITIKGQDGGPLRINAADFKVGEHELFEGSSDTGATGSSAGKDAGGDTGATGSTGPAASAPMGAPAPRGAAAPSK